MMDISGLTPRQEKIISRLIHQLKTEVATARNDTYMLVGCLHNALAAIVQIIYANNERYFMSDKGAIKECAMFGQIPENFLIRIEQILRNPSIESVQQLHNLLGEVTA